jgi:hypothetical protein
LEHFLTIVDVRLAVIAEEKANLQARFLRVQELRRQLSKGDVGGTKRIGAGLELRQAATAISRPSAAAIQDRERIYLVT